MWLGGWLFHLFVTLLFLSTVWRWVSPLIPKGRIRRRPMKCLTFLFLSFKTQLFVLVFSSFLLSCHLEKSVLSELEKHSLRECVKHSFYVFLLCFTCKSWRKTICKLLIYLNKLWHLIPSFSQYKAEMSLTTLWQKELLSLAQLRDAFTKTGKPKVQRPKAVRYKKLNNQRTGLIWLLRVSELFSCLAKILSLILHISTMLFWKTTLKLYFRVQRIACSL